MIIGKFSRTSDGWVGCILTVTSHTKVRFIPNDKRENERAPDFRVICGECELGVAWRRSSHAEAEREYLSVILDGPFLVAPFSAALFELSREGEANLVWKRQRDGNTSVEE